MKDILKKTLFLSFLLFTSYTFSQEKRDYALARAADYVSGVYAFYYCTPYYEYEYVGRIKRFKFWKWAPDKIEKKFYKRIKKTKKKYPDFDAVIFKRNNKTVEVVKFIDRERSTATYKIGDRVNYYTKNIIGQVIFIEAEIIGLKSDTDAIIKYTDKKGREKVKQVNLKNLSRTKNETQIPQQALPPSE